MAAAPRLGSTGRALGALALTARAHRSHLQAQLGVRVSQVRAPIRKGGLWKTERSMPARAVPTSW